MKKRTLIDELVRSEDYLKELKSSIKTPVTIFPADTPAVTPGLPDPGQTTATTSTKQCPEKEQAGASWTYAELTRKQRAKLSQLGREGSRVMEARVRQLARELKDVSCGPM